ncbi:glycosyltransferase [Naasia lichenicola]|uniref:D-inositol 3-phosphate glycosyltransferase n=1 Tax=Naasia lichenicola TaxID=2565933 RepID=A0A4S4FL50_9MICO|nr:glycosyltransferase [Naasia lichenicola]THG31079.1 glycosyltransferase [Naasia lichenicola]
MGIQTSLDAIRDADRLIDSMRLADDLAFEASRDGGVRTIRLLTAATADRDQVVAIAATHALGQVFDQQADLAISRLLSDARPFIREHAAWVLGSRLPRFDAIGRLIGMVVAGGFTGMLAQRALEQWAAAIPDHIGVALEGTLLGGHPVDARVRLVETLGLVRNRIATRPLLALAGNASEAEAVRVAAISALGQRGGDRAVVELLTELADLGSQPGSDLLADVARLALVDLSASTQVRVSAGGPLTIAQLFLHADIDAGLTHAGSGDNGGIATLLVRLGDALTAPAGSEPPIVERVLTLSRGSVASALASVVEISGAQTGHDYGRVPLLTDPVASAAAWPLRVAARRGIRRILRAAGGVDALHLRMADVGSLAAADVARELDIPVIFTVAPDPHAVIHSLDQSGSLGHADFGDVDIVEHFWFRARLVQQLAGNAAHTVLFPRPELARDMKELVGIDIAAHPERHSIVPEGIDLGVVDRAVAEASAAAGGGAESHALGELRALLEELPSDRRDLPLLVSVGRFHRVKGMASIVEAWAAGEPGTRLRDRANLLLIGGDLAHPSLDEREQLERMNAIVPQGSRAAAGLLLPGHRPNDTVARWVAAARFGVPGLVAPNGVYVCGSLKEEFGIALLEAMASGLFVVAPAGGGPATYVEQGVTGILTTTWDLEQLRVSMAAALDLTADERTEDRAAESRRVVADKFTIGAMAAALSTVYLAVGEEERRQQDLSVPIR